MVTVTLAPETVVQIREGDSGSYQDATWAEITQDMDPDTLAEIQRGLEVRGSHRLVDHVAYSYRLAAAH